MTVKKTDMLGEKSVHHNKPHMESPSAAYDQMTTGRIKDKLEVTSLG
jgi:hypothetical protein